MPTENLGAKEQRKGLLKRLSRLSVQYRNTRLQTTLATGSRQTPTSVLPSFTQDVVQFEQPTHDNLQQQAAFLGCVFQVGTEPKSIVVTDIVETMNNKDNNIWIDLSGYGEEDFEVLTQALQIHPGAVQIALAPWKSPRLDVFRGYFFVTATLPFLHSSPYHVQAHQISMFVGKNFFLSAHHVAMPFLEHILTRCALRHQSAQVDSAFLLYILLDELLTHYEDLHVQMQEQIELMEERALLDTSNQFLNELLHFKRYAFALSQLAEQHRAIFAVFLRPDFDYISQQEIMVYYRDLEARLARLTDCLRTAKEASNGIFDIYVSHVSHRTNNVMKLLTMVSTVMLPSTLIFTFFSTYNIQDIPIFTHRIGFVLMICSVVCVSSTILWQFRCKGWM